MQSAELRSTLPLVIQEARTPEPIQQMSPDMQASLRSYYWSMVQSAGLRTFSWISLGKLSGRLELKIGSPRDGGMACRYADESIEISRDVANQLISYHLDPSSFASGGFTLGTPGDAHLSVLHETVHCCGTSRPSNKGSSASLHFSTNIDEMITELCARQILADHLEIPASEIYGSRGTPDRHDCLGSYDYLILPAAWAVGSICDCSDAQAIDKLARAALQIRRENPVIDDFAALGMLVDLATA